MLRLDFVLVPGGGELLEGEGLGGKVGIRALKGHVYPVRGLRKRGGGRPSGGLGRGEIMRGLHEPVEHDVHKVLAVLRGKRPRNPVAHLLEHLLGPLPAVQRKTRKIPQRLRGKKRILRRGGVGLFGLFGLSGRVGLSENLGAHGGLGFFEGIGVGTHDGVRVPGGGPGLFGLFGRVGIPERVGGRGGVGFSGPVGIPDGIPSRGGVGGRGALRSAGGRLVLRGFKQKRGGIHQRLFQRVEVFAHHARARVQAPGDVLNNLRIPRFEAAQRLRLLPAVTPDERHVGKGVELLGRRARRIGGQPVEIGQKRFRVRAALHADFQLRLRCQKTHPHRRRFRFVVLLKQGAVQQRGYARVEILHFLQGKPFGIKHAGPKIFEHAEHVFGHLELAQNVFRRQGILDRRGRCTGRRGRCAGRGGRCTGRGGGERRLVGEIIVLDCRGRRGRRGCVRGGSP